VPSREICDGKDNDCDGLIDNNSICQPPVISGTTPASPSSNLTPHINGTAPANSTVSLFTNSACTGGAVATGTATGGNFSIAATVGANTVTTFYANAMDALGDSSPCSPSSVTYSSDNTAPAPPTITTSTPASPGISTNPVLNGTAENGALVTIYNSNICVTSLGSGPASGGTFHIAVPAAINSLTAFYAKAQDAAGNVSACAGPFSYTNDTVPPAAPVINGTIPASPSTNITPLVTGTGEPGATVSIFKSSAACTGLPAASGVINGGGTFAITVAVTPTSTTTFNASATDAAGNLSACSSPGFNYIAQ
jgi:hypothetical protein